MTTEPDLQTRAAFAADGVTHAKEARSVPYAGPKLVDQPPIPVEGRNGERPSVPQAATTILGRNVAITQAEPTEPQSIFNQAVALHAMCKQPVSCALWAAAELLHHNVRPSRAELEAILVGLDELASRAVQLRHSLSTHS